MRKITLAFVLMLWLVISLPIVHAETLNLVTDANGNLVTGDGLFRVYNSFNQLVEVRNGSDSSAPLLQRFTYHPTEERIDIKRTYNSSGTVIETVYYWTKTYVEVVNLSGDYNFTYVYHEGQLIAQELQGTKQFIHGNHEGSSSVVTNSTGQVVERTEYTPFGEIVSGGTKTRYGYEHKEFDSAVGDLDFGFRKYCAKWGVFCQPDTLIQNVYDPQSLNRYMFERGNPYKNTDPTGHEALTALLIVGIVAAILTVSHLLLQDFAREFPPESEKSKNDGSLKNDVAKEVAKTTAQETAKKGAEKATQKLAAKKIISEKVVPKALNVIRKVNIAVTTVLGVKEGIESISILEKYEDKEFEEKFNQYMKLTWAEKNDAKDQSIDANPASSAPPMKETKTQTQNELNEG